MRMYIFWFVREGTRTEWDIIYYELVMTGSSFMQHTYSTYVLLYNTNATDSLTL